MTKYTGCCGKGAAFCCALFFSAALFAGSPEAAEKYIEERHLDWSYIQKAETELLEVLKTEPENLKANLLMSRVCLFKGEKTENNDEKIKLYDKAASFGKIAIKINPKSADAHFYYSAGIGKNAQLKGIFNALGMVGEIKAEMDKTVELDPKHVIGLNALAQYYMELPGIFGGSIEKTEELLLKAKELDPNLSMTYVTLGKMYLRQGKRDKAKEALETVIKMKNPSKPAYYALDDLPDAQRLLKDIKE